MDISQQRIRGSLDGATAVDATQVAITIYDERDASPQGAVWRLPDGRLAVLTVQDNIDEGTESTVKALIQSQILGGGTAVLVGNMRSLGVDAGLEAWAQGD